MTREDLIRSYSEDGIIKTLAENFHTEKIIQLKGLSGSISAVILASLFSTDKSTSLVVLADKEDAAYFFNDVREIIGNEKVLFFPASYKRPYQYEEIENANVLLRSEVLTWLNNDKSEPTVIITYSEALGEKVVNKRSLSKNTYPISVGDRIDQEFLISVLINYDFEKADFVYEAGQFAVRGGIVDIFSFSNEIPYRVEFFGDSVESIRTFNPESQLSIDKLNSLSLIPNVQTKLLHEERQPFLHFLPANSSIWFDDLKMTLDIIESNFAKCSVEFNSILESAGNTQVVLSPETLFENKESFLKCLSELRVVEFGSRFHFRRSFLLQFNTHPQPSFNKNFELMARELEANQRAGIRNIIAAESPKQLERLMTIFEEINPDLKAEELNISIHKGFIDKDLGQAIYTDHEVFERFHRYRLRDQFTKSRALTLKELQNLHPGDYVTHIDYGIGRFVGMETVEMNGRKQESIRLIYRDDDLLFLSVHSLHKISKYSGKEGVPPVMSKLGSAEWDNKKKRIKKKVIDIASDLIKLYAKRKQSEGFAFSADSFLQAELESSFIYEDTPDQAKATEDVKVDMQEAHPMDRLVCGDVGFGKTEVAIRAAFKAVCDGKQAAVLVPTTILAMQHYRTFTERLANFPVGIEYVNRFKPARKVKEILQDVDSGKINILIGTHRIVNKDVRFKDLGLLVIDEEQKFGVKVKERLKEIKVNVDVLTLTATPIPRTLHFSLMGARDLSIISTPPANRQPVTTELHEFNETVIRDAISFELQRGGQVFFVHNRISDIDEVANIVLRLVPDARIGVAHGQMVGDKLEKTMLRFIEGYYDILVSTNIIESGLDIPNANTIIISHAHMFGMSDLHQMRGRVGRSNRKAFCYLLTPPSFMLSSDARKRLTALEEFSELGDGFKVAMRDLDIRGAGNLLGSEQSGFINDLGFETYHKLLDETIQELKETEFKDLFIKPNQNLQYLVQDCIIETDLEVLIPDFYVENISERLSLYSKLDNIKTEDELKAFTDSISDRFGKLPDSVGELIETVKLRWLGESLGFEKIVLKNSELKCHFISPNKETYFQSDTFGKIIDFVQSHSSKCKLLDRKNRLVLTITDIPSVHAAIDFLIKIKI
ncbi:MAG TPA: transcription-repair coupling factor [Cyclobacteriaceae bacterium]